MINFFHKKKKIICIETICQLLLSNYYYCSTFTVKIKTVKTVKSIVDMLFLHITFSHKEHDKGGRRERERERERKRERRVIDFVSHIICRNLPTTKTSILFQKGRRTTSSMRSVLIMLPQLFCT